MGWHPHRLAGLALVAAALACVTLAGARIADNLSLHTPLQLVTSGAEQEALDSIWRSSHDLPVYTDPHAIPYTASCFNWLFYAVYGSFTGTALRVFHLNDAWLPTLARWLTLGLSLAGVAIMARVLSTSAHPEATDVRLKRKTPGEFISRYVAAALALLAFFNPLCGFWTLTARPDIGAALLELTGVTFFCRYLQDGSFRKIALAALAVYGAWAFKQTTLGALAGMVLTLLFLRRARALGLLVAIWLGGVATSVALLGPAYRQQLYFGQIHSGFDLSWAVPHLGLALLKMPLIGVALAGLVFTWKRHEPDPVRPAVGLILMSTLAFNFLAATKGGAGDYYFIPLGVWSALWIGLVLRGNAKESPERFEGRPASARRYPPGVTGAIFLPAGAIIAAMLIVVDVLAIFIGHCGMIDCRDPRQPYEHLAHYLAARPGPVFVQDTYGNLPWISPTAPHFVVAFNNEADQLAGVKFERGGWQGLLAQGYFSTVVTRADGDAVIASMPANYRLVDREAGWNYFYRK